MHRRCLLNYVLVLALLTVCACQPEPQPITPTPHPTSTPMPPSLAGAEMVALQYLRAWQNGAYERMYTMLSSSAAQTTSLEDFCSRYRTIATEATMTRLEVSPTGVGRVLMATAQVTYTLSMDTLLAGSFQLDNALDLSYDGQRWAVDWTPKAIFPLLVWDNLVHMFVQVPARGNIYDRNDLPLATEGQVIEIGVVPDQIEDEARLLYVLSVVLGLPTDTIQAKYAHAGREDWFMPIGELAPKAAQANESLLSSAPGIAWREKSVRAYPHGSMAAQVIGYLAEIDAETLSGLTVQGYSPGDLVGASGLEGWGEQYLASERGGKLAIISPDGRIVWTLSERTPRPSRSIYTTLDVDLQRATEDILGERIGAIAVLDARNGDVLALASYPRFDPAMLTAGATDAQWQALINDPRHPLLDRAIAGVYPPGSSFKIVTMSAGMEELGLTEHATFYCPGYWDGLADGLRRYCWVRSGHGTLDLVHGLMHSCNIVFWTIGKALNEHDPYALPRYARGFGLGAPTGLKALQDAAGLIPDPDWKAKNYSGAEQQWLPRDAVNMSTGQGDVLVTPLQMARLAAAVGNGGTLYRPRLVRRAGSLMGDDMEEFPPEVVGHLPVSAANLAVVRRAMEGVVTGGSAMRAFIGATVRMAGKSGTAEAPPYEPHAWFVGYAPADDPQVAVAVVLEHGGEGGRNSAPLFRQVVEAYLGLAQP